LRATPYIAANNAPPQITKISKNHSSDNPQYDIVYLSVGQMA
jgi:hypothetical protein